MDSSKSPKSLSWWLALAITLLTALVGYLSTSCSLTRSAHYQVDSTKIDYLKVNLVFLYQIMNSDFTTQRPPPIIFFTNFVTK